MRQVHAVAAAALMSVGFQAGLSAQVSIGGRVGANVAQVSAKESGTSVTGLDSRVGFHAGADLLFGITEVVGVRTGALYSQKGTKDTQAGVTGIIKGTYVDIPLVANITIPTGGQSNISPRLFAGGQLSFELSCDVELSDATTSLTSTCSDAGLETKSTDIGLLFGGGISVGIGPGSLTFDIAYALGVTDLDESADDEARNRVLSFSGGFTFPVGAGR